MYKNISFHRDLGHRFFSFKTRWRKNGSLVFVHASLLIFAAFSKSLLKNNVFVSNFITVYIINDNSWGILYISHRVCNIHMHYKQAALFSLKYTYLGERQEITFSFLFLNSESKIITPLVQNFSASVHVIIIIYPVWKEVQKGGKRLKRMNTIVTKPSRRNRV